MTYNDNLYVLLDYNLYCAYRETNCANWDLLIQGTCITE